MVPEVAFTGDTTAEFVVDSADESSDCCQAIRQHAFTHMIVTALQEFHKL